MDTRQTDRVGTPIYVGDLIRVKHYRHILRRKQMWLYFIVGVVENVPVVFNCPATSGAHQCMLASVGECEVIGETGIHRSTKGEIMTFNERPRR